MIDYLLKGDRMWGKGHLSLYRLTGKDITPAKHDSTEKTFWSILPLVKTELEVIKT